MYEKNSYAIDDSKEPNFEGWKLSTTYNPEKDFSADKDKFYVLQNPDSAKSDRYVSKDLGYISEDGSFHYYPVYRKH